MKKILYDNQMFTLQRFGGVTRYFASLIRNVPKEEFMCEMPMQYSENPYISDVNGNSYNKITIPGIYNIRHRIYKLVNKRIAKNAVRHNDFDIFHPTYYDPYFLDAVRTRNKPFVLTVHDMTFERYPQDALIFDGAIPYKKHLIAMADHIIAVSENTKRDIVTLLGTDPSRVSVVHHGYSLQSEVAPQLFERYILYVGERKGYKNFFPWLSAIRPLLVAYPTIKVVCTGNAFSRHEEKLFHKWGIADSLRHISANEAQLASLYKYALCFVFPSHYEGFGMPILEAFANGCPVCLSNTSCFYEVAGDAALYFNPNDAQLMYDTLREIILNSTLRDELRGKGAERIKEFTVERMIQGTCEVYRKL